MTMTEKGKKAPSPCAHLRTAYNNCFNRWYAEKFVKGEWNKEGCTIEWQKYRDCLSEYLDDKHLSRFLEGESIPVDLGKPEYRRIAGMNCSKYDMTLCCR